MVNVEGLNRKSEENLYNGQQNNMPDLLVSVRATQI